MDFRKETLVKKDFNGSEIEQWLYRNGRCEEFEIAMAEACVDAYIIHKSDLAVAMDSTQPTVRMMNVRRLIACGLEYGRPLHIIIKRKGYSPLVCEIVKGASRLVISMGITVYKMLYSMQHGDQNKKEVDAYRKASFIHEDVKPFIANVYREFPGYKAEIACKAHSVAKYDNLKDICKVTGHEYYKVMTALEKIGVTSDLHMYNIGIFQNRPCVIDYGME